MRPIRPLLPLLLLLAAAPAALACTNLIVSPGASADGSTIVTYTCDGEFHPILRLIEADQHEPGALQDITDWGGNVLGQVPYPERTWHVVNLMNEHQVSIAETTTGGRDELTNPDGLLHYWTLMRLALQRATTAREAVQVMGRLVADHGYRSTGESFAIGDPDEAWIMEMVGPGPGGAGAHWVAIRVPDGMISAYANGGRIGTIPGDGGRQCLHSDLQAMQEFARTSGWWDPADGPFNWREAFHPATVQQLRYTATRVWSLFRRAAPSLDLPAGFHRGEPGAEPYPLFVKPDAKLAVPDVFALMRDHYEGTPWDMTRGVDAGPHGNPVRYRPMGWEVDGEVFTWERPISTQQTGFSMVCQSRRWLPDPVGGLTWYGLDDTDVTCYLPLYCSITALPESYATGTLGAFDWDSAWWVFNLVGNYAMLRYDAMIADVRAAQADLEGTFLDLQPAVEATAAQLAKSDPELMRRYLTDYSVQHGELVTRRWRELAEHLLTTYNDGYVKDERGRPREQGYSDAWLRAVLEQRPDQFRLPADTPRAQEPEDY
ncbi:MAG: C69 family dipeptidase [Candidatus Krumholzibacteriia bacterium]